MKKIIFACTVALLAACTSSTNNTADNDSIAETSTAEYAKSDSAKAMDAMTGKQDVSSFDACYLRVEGGDSSIIKLRLHGGVDGDYNWLPAEKDARRGKITANNAGDKMKGTWVFTQEGVKDSLPVEFKISGDGLVMKSYKADPATGRQYLDPKAPFDIIFKKVACRSVH